MVPKGKARAKVSKRLSRLGSKITALDAAGQVFRAFCVWCPDAPAVRKDPDILFAKCTVLPGSNDDTFKLRQIEPEEDNTVFECAASRCYNSNTITHPEEFTDIGMLPHTNDPCVLDFLKQRLMIGNIFVTAEPLLVIQNPFKNLGNATNEWIIKYRDHPDPSKLPPHVFSVARFALENLHSVNKSQTIIVSGESGAGKTEATKQTMRFFAAAKTGGGLDLRVQRAILAANPVLEAFGNAKTIRNNNSSRFGRYMQLLIARGGGILNGSVQGFLLEKSRILQQVDNERSYHVFYQLLKGATGDLKRKLKLRSLKDYQYLNHHCLEASGIDDVSEWNDLLESFKSMGMTESESDTVLSICSGVLLLGNVKIKGVEKQGLDDAGVIDESCRRTFQDACDLLFLDASRVEEGITVKVSVAGGDEIRGCWRQGECDMLKSSLAKAMYDSIFQWIIRKLNSNIEPKEPWTQYMGMLDIFGFEVFENNSLEQLFINVTNEMLQKNFTETVFEKESRLYKSEGIPVSELVFTSNAEVIGALTAKRESVFAILEDQCLAPAGTDEKFLSTLYDSLKDSAKVYPAKVASQQNFIVNHTIGEIKYNVDGFLFKNKDVLRPELIEVIQESRSPLAASLYAGVVVEKGKSAKGQLIGSQFMSQLQRLMDLINATEVHFIRCVKPNEEKLPLMFTPSKVIVQLQSLSILEALQLRNLGYSYRRPFADFLHQYRFLDLGIAEDKTMDTVEATKALLRSAQVPDHEWKVGKTMIFMKPNAVKTVAQRQRQAMASWTNLANIIEALYRRRVLKREYSNRRHGIVRTQALTRRKLFGIVPLATSAQIF